MDGLNVFNGRPINFQDNIVRKDDLMAAFENLEYVAKEVFGKNNVANIEVEGYENIRGMNMRHLVIHFSKTPDQIKRRSFVDSWKMTTTRDNGDIRLSSVPIGFRFAEPKGVS